MSTDINNKNYKNNIKNPDGIIFDLDGTLWDSSAKIAEAWNLLLKTRPDIIREDITQEELYANMGLPMYDIAANLFPNEESSVRNALMDDMGIFENDYLLKTGGHLFPDIRDVILRSASKAKVFVVSNCQSGYIEAFISAHGFEGIFTDYICWGDTGKCKGDNISYICRKHELNNPVYIGDTDSDSKACAKANIPFIFAEYGFGNTDVYDAKIQKPADLYELLKL